MEIDRQLVLVVGFAVLGLALFGGLYLSSAPAPAHDGIRPIYTPEDVRYKIQQAELKNKRKGLPVQTDDGGASSSSSSSSGDEEGGEDQPAEEPDAEEPALE